MNIDEKAAGFTITGDTGSEGAVSVTVTVGTTELTATSADADPATWSVSVPQGRDLHYWHERRCGPCQRHDQDRVHRAR